MALAPYTAPPLSPDSPIVAAWIAAHARALPKGAKLREVLRGRTASGAHVRVVAWRAGGAPSLRVDGGEYGGDADFTGEPTPDAVARALARKAPGAAWEDPSAIRAPTAPGLWLSPAGADLVRAANYGLAGNGGAAAVVAEDGAGYLIGSQRVTPGDVGCDWIWAGGLHRDEIAARSWSVVLAALQRWAQVDAALRALAPPTAAPRVEVGDRLRFDALPDGAVARCEAGQFKDDVALCAGGGYRWIWWCGDPDDRAGDEPTRERWQARCEGAESGGAVWRVLALGVPAGASAAQARALAGIGAGTAAAAAALEPAPAPAWAVGGKVETAEQAETLPRGAVLRDKKGDLVACGGDGYFSYIETIHGPTCGLPVAADARGWRAIGLDVPATIVALGSEEDLNDAARMRVLLGWADPPAAQGAAAPEAEVKVGDRVEAARVPLGAVARYKSGEVYHVREDRRIQMIHETHGPADRPSTDGTIERRSGSGAVWEVLALGVPTTATAQQARIAAGLEAAPAPVKVGDVLAAAAVPADATAAQARIAAGLGPESASAPRVGSAIPLKIDAWRALPVGALARLQRTDRQQRDFSLVRKDREATALGDAGMWSYRTERGEVYGNAGPWMLAGAVAEARLIALDSPADPAALAAVVAAADRWCAPEPEPEPAAAAAAAAERPQWVPWAQVPVGALLLDADEDPLLRTADGWVRFGCGSWAWRDRDEAKSVSPPGAVYRCRVLREGLPADLSLAAAVGYGAAAGIEAAGVALELLSADEVQAARAIAAGSSVVAVGSGPLPAVEDALADLEQLVGAAAAMTLRAIARDAEGGERSVLLQGPGGEHERPRFAVDGGKVCVICICLCSRCRGMYAEWSALDFDLGSTPASRRAAVAAAALEAPVGALVVAPWPVVQVALASHGVAPGEPDRQDGALPRSIGEEAGRALAALAARRVGALRELRLGALVVREVEPWTWEATAAAASCEALRPIVGRRVAALSAMHALRRLSAGLSGRRDLEVEARAAAVLSARQGREALGPADGALMPDALGARGRVVYRRVHLLEPRAAAALPLPSGGAWVRFATASAAGAAIVLQGAWPSREAARAVAARVVRAATPPLCRERGAPVALVADEAGDLLAWAGALVGEPCRV